MLFTTVRFTKPEEIEKYTRQVNAEALAVVPAPPAVGQTKGRKKRRPPAPAEPATLHFIPKTAVTRKHAKGRR
jgi:hypothetical protein